MWSFVQQRKNKVWVWLALCRRTRQDAHVRSWPMPWVVAAKRLAVSCGATFLKTTKTACATPTSGRLMLKSYHPNNMIAATNEAKLTISNAGTILCDNAWDALCDAHFLFLNATKCTKPPCACSFTTTTRPAHLIEPLPNVLFENLVYDASYHTAKQQVPPEGRNFSLCGSSHHHGMRLAQFAQRAAKALCQSACRAVTQIV